MLLAIVSFGASSIYWLALAFLLPAASYGKMMTLQASILLITTIFACRTFDLMFFLVTKLGYRAEASFRVALTCEAVSVVTTTLVCSVGALLVYRADLGLPSAGGVIALAFTSSVATAQGASMGKLRYLVRNHVIARADYLTIACWGAAGISLIALRNHSPIVLLVVGTLPTAVRTIALGLGARASRAAHDGKSFERMDLGTILKFLAGGQVVNFSKNSSVSIETMILAAFCPPTSVAMYRLARSGMGITTAASNITWQQGVSSLARADSREHKVEILRRMRREGLLLAIGMYPVAAVFGLVYALSKHDIDVVTLQLVTLGVGLSFIPAVLQQGPIALLSLEGANGKVNTGFAIGIAALVLLSCALFVLPSIAIFLTALIASSAARLAYLEWKARAQIR
jgi:hypothetical protein